MSLFDPPVYQIWLSIVQRITMGIPGLIAAFAVALSLITPWCWYRFLREAIASRTLALSGWAAFSLLPTWIGIFSYFMTETLLLPLLGLSLWMTLRAQRRPTLGTFLAMIVVWLITGLTRGVTIPLAGVACTLVWFRHPNKVSAAAVSAFILMAVLTPLAIRNHHFIHLWAPHGNGWLTRIYAESGSREISLHMERDGAQWHYGFTSPMMDEQPFAPLSDWKTGRTGTVHVSVDLNRGAQDWERALQQNGQSGAERWKLHAENLVYLFQGNSWPDNNPAYVMGRLANISRWLWIPLFLFILSVSIWQWRVCLKKPLLPLLIATWFFFQAWLLISVNEGRYRKPVEGLLIAQACVLADTWSRKTKGAL
ncbi:MAG: hypothetical protein HGA78_05140 [Nitrospirales bacterium]|nr:hypothetical protein [Nitrospirales bacterium]